MTRRRKVKGIVPLCFLLLISCCSSSSSSWPCLAITFVRKNLLKKNLLYYLLYGVLRSQETSAHWSFFPAPDLTAVYSAAVRYSCSIFFGAAMCLFIWLSQSEVFLHASRLFVSVRIYDLMCFHSIDFPWFRLLSEGAAQFRAAVVLLCCCCQVGLLGDNEDWLMVHQVSNQPEARSLEVPALNPYTHYRSGPLAAFQHNKRKMLISPFFEILIFSCNNIATNVHIFMKKNSKTFLPRRFF